MGCSSLISHNRTHTNTYLNQGDNNSAESFERTLSSLAQKISKTSAKNDALRQRSRKLKVSWTIYGGFTYILTALIFILVTGWQNWGWVEYSTVAGGPVLLWGVRRALTLWYDYRIKNTTEYLEGLQKERDGTIEKSKRATKYDSTQQLIDKYSSKPSTPKTEEKGSASKGGKRVPSQGGQQGPPQGQQRVFTQPPPTANIPRGPVPPPQQPHSRPTSAGSLHGQQPLPYQQSPTGPPQPSAEFAPNAFSEPAPTAPASYGEATWYDRILDALLGEDETSAKNRFALICSSCKLVNGQAPPGARTLEDVGKWRCSACGAMNGVENETKKLVESVEKSLPVPDVDGASGGDEGEDIVVAEETSGEEDAADTPAISTRSKKGGRKG